MRLPDVDDEEVDLLAALLEELLQPTG